MTGPIVINEDKFIELVKETIKNSDKGYLEIAKRAKKGTIKTLQKFVLSDDFGKKDGVKEVVNKVLETTKAISKSTKIIESGISTLNKLSSFNLVLNGMNLFATAATFAILNQKLNEINRKIDAVLDNAKKVEDINKTYKFNKVLSEYRNMLDYRKRNKDYTEEKYRKLVDDQYNVLKLLLASFKGDIVKDKEAILYAIISLSSMLGNTIINFDELYYYENKNHITNGRYWHESHDEWMRIYDELTDDKFKVILQDFMFLDLGYSQYEMDLFIEAVMDTFNEAKVKISDQQKLIEQLETKENYDLYKIKINEYVIKEIENAINSIEDENVEEITEVFEEAKLQLGLVTL
ncbi:MAG: hypothetical protein QM266_07970 [Bacillota bacterium]|nr:hypothetical protein [Bacillota bacterium]